MALTTSRPAVRISRVSNRYLVFDVEDVMYLRKNHYICSPFIGTLPQNPAQSVFLGLPMELMAEEAQALVAKNVAYVVDDAAFHLAQVPSLDDATRGAHLEAIATETKKAQIIASEIRASKKPKNVQIIKKDRKKKKTVPESSPEMTNPEETNTSPDTAEETSLELFDTSKPAAVPVSKSKPKPKVDNASNDWQATLTSSNSLLPSSSENAPIVPVDSSSIRSPLYAYLQDKGFYMMPGIRFGCDYNVYPGDPLRYHSHFQAKAYGWEEPIPLLDLVCAGRLATVTKKSVLIGGEVPRSEKQTEDQEDGAGETGVVPPVRVFSIEWARM